MEVVVVEERSAGGDGSVQGGGGVGVKVQQEVMEVQEVTEVEEVVVEGEEVMMKDS